jgi:uncharacterized damage-inducible protein DinB
MTGTVADLFLKYSIEKLQQQCAHVKACVAELSDEQVWHRGSEACNSIGNLILHLTGNMRQWIGHGVGGQADIRERDAEFAARGGRSSRDITDAFEAIVSDAVAILHGVTAERLTERTRPQKHDVSVLEAIYQVTGHLQEHTGQIVFATKQMTGKDFRFFTPKP